MHVLGYQQGPDTKSAGRYVGRVLFLDRKWLSRLLGTVRLEVGVRGGVAERATHCLLS